MKSLGRVASIIGIGQSDWTGDWARVRRGEQPSDSYGYAATAFRAALSDAGISRDQVDGLIVGPTTAYERRGRDAGRPIADLIWVRRPDR